MELKEIRKDIYDVDAWVDEGLGAVGTPQRDKAMEEAWDEYNISVELERRFGAVGSLERQEAEREAREEYVNEAFMDIKSRWINASEEERKVVDLELNNFLGSLSKEEMEMLLLSIQKDFKRMRGESADIERILTTTSRVGH